MKPMLVILNPIEISPDCVTPQGLETVSPLRAIVRKALQTQVLTDPQRQTINTILSQNQGSEDDLVALSQLLIALRNRTVISGSHFAGSPSPIKHESSFDPVGLISLSV